MDFFTFDLTETQLNALSSLALAHIGDAVYELMARSYLVSRGRGTNRSLHRETVALVAAPAQAEGAERIADMLSDEEREVFRRGRNARVRAVPHGATTSQYHAATALETLFGFLYLKGRRERLNELFAAILEVE